MVRTALYSGVLTISPWAFVTNSGALIPLSEPIVSLVTTALPVSKA